MKWIAAAVDLAVRLVVANVFWQSGMVKVASWQSTLMLFDQVYSVPLLPPALAAWLAAAVELGGSALLALGLGGRIGAAALSVLNVVAVISYADLSDVGRQDHLYWGLFLALFVVHGPGRLSVDFLLRRRFLAPGTALASSFFGKVMM